MKYKAIMLDLDDTTVVHGKDNMPTKRVADAIARAKEKIHVCVATARTLPDAKPVLTHLELSGPCVLTNGTQIYDPVTRTVVYEVKLPIRIVPNILALCLQYGLRAFVYNGLRDFQYSGKEKLDKVLSVYIPEVEPDKVDHFVDMFAIDPAIHVQKLTAWDKRFMSIDITSNKASKLHGILKVAKLLKIKTSEIIGVGDGYNDFPLLLACGLKIAMGNAVPELKAIADFVAPSVAEDGVATVIEKFILT